MEDQESVEQQLEGEVLQLVCFMFADEEYAVDIVHVQEVIRAQKITHVPQMPDFTLGVINIRGNIIPVFDLRRKFGLREKSFDGDTKMIVANVSGSQICFIVDAVLDNVKLRTDSIVPAPTVKMKIKRECIKGIGKFENQMIIILDLERLNESILEDIKELSVKEQVQSL